MTNKLDADKVIEEGEIVKHRLKSYEIITLESFVDSAKKIEDLLTLAKQQRDRIRELRDELDQFQPMVSCGFADEVYYHKVKPKEPS